MPRKRSMTGAVAAEAATAASAGAVGAFLASLSLDPGLLLAGLAGATLGVLRTPPERATLRSIAVFAATALTSAWAGALAEVLVLPGTARPDLVRNVAAIVVGVIAHPLANGLVSQTPTFLRRLLESFIPRGGRK